MRRYILLGISLCALVCGPVTHAQTLTSDEQDFWLARVESVESSRTETEGFDVLTHEQVLSMRVLEGVRAGNTISVVNDYAPLSAGDSAYVVRVQHAGGEEFFHVFEKDRRGVLLALLVFFVGSVVLLGGVQGVRALASLAGGLLVVVYVLAPALMQGYEPVLVSTAVATVILFVAIFFTHGFNRDAAVAFTGTIVAVCATGLLAYITVYAARFSGFSSDDAVYLNLATGGQLDIAGLLLASIIIGILGVLDDVAITQVAVVRELRTAAGHLSRMDVYRRALNVGREHAGALVNTLVLAYVSAALPLLLLFVGTTSSFVFIVNREIVAIEIVRALVGSIGLMLTVPVTTLFAVYVPLWGKAGTHMHTHTH